MEIEPTSEPATKAELALVRAELLAEIRNLRTWAEGRFARLEEKLEERFEIMNARLEALRQEMLGRIKQTEKRMWRAMALQFAAIVGAVSAIQKWL